MAITTVSGAYAGMKPVERFMKQNTITPTAIAPDRYVSFWYVAGSPAAGAAPSPGVNGAAVTAPVTGQLEFSNPASGNSYLTKFVAHRDATGTTAVEGTFILCDRIWHNSGLSVTLTTLQSITPVAIGARDSDGATAGRGVYAALEVSTIMGAGTPTYTLTYTNSAGTGSRTAVIPAVAAAAPVGTFYTWPLQAGDIGVRSVEGFQASATSTSGAFHIILFRPIVSIPCKIGIPDVGVDLLTSGFPRLYNDTVPFIIRMPVATGGASVETLGAFGYAQG